MKSQHPAYFSLLLSTLALLALSGCNKGKPSITLTTDYQAVYMDNNQVFFGKVEQANSDFPILRDVFYVQNQVNPETKEVKNLLVKRGQEWHAPEYMHLNTRHILAIEPVAPNSQLAQLIQQAKGSSTIVK